MKRIFINCTDVSPTILSGYFKFGTATLIGGGYGTTGASIAEVYEVYSSIER